MARVVYVSIEADFEDTTEVADGDQHLTDEQLHDKFADNASRLFDEAVAEGNYNLGSIEVEVKHV